MEQPDTETSYLENRWKSQKDYYSKNSRRNKKWYLRVKLFMGLGAVAVPVVLSIQEPDLRIFAGVLSAFVAGAAVLENVYNYGDNWRTFRQTSELLKRERVLYEAGAGPYRYTKNREIRFVERCEEIIAEETGQYFQHEEETAQKNATD